MALRTQHIFRSPTQRSNTPSKHTVPIAHQSSDWEANQSADTRRSRWISQGTSQASSQYCWWEGVFWKMPKSYQVLSGWNLKEIGEIIWVMIYDCQLAVCVSTPKESMIPEWELSPGVLVSSRNTLLAFGVIYVVDGRAYFGKCPKLSWSPGVELERDKRDYWDDDLWLSIGSLCVHPYRIHQKLFYAPYRIVEMFFHLI